MSVSITSLNGATVTSFAILRRLWDDARDQPGLVRQDTLTAGPARPGSSYAPFCGRINMPDGWIVLVPLDHPTIGLISPAGVYMDGPVHGQGAGAFIGGVLTATGECVFIPRRAPRFVFFRRETNKVRLGPAHGYTTSSSAFAYSGAALGLDDILYCGPGLGTKIARLDVRANTLLPERANVCPVDIGTATPGNPVFSGTHLTRGGQILLWCGLNRMPVLYTPETDTYTPGTPHGLTVGTPLREANMDWDGIFWAPRVTGRTIHGYDPELGQWITGTPCPDWLTDAGATTTTPMRVVLPTRDRRLAMWPHSMPWTGAYDPITGVWEKGVKLGATSITDAYRWAAEMPDGRIMGCPQGTTPDFQFWSLHSGGAALPLVCRSSRFTNRA